MDESITRAAGGVNGQEFGVAQMRELAEGLGRPLVERSTTYRPMRVTEDNDLMMESVF